MKARQRNSIKEILSFLDEKDRKNKSHLISNNLQELVNELNIHDQIIGCYAPIQKEPLWFLSFLNGRFALPSIRESFEMDFFEVELEKVKSGSYGLKIDDSSLIKVEPKIIFVPGLAFTKNGERLGRGKGYYDRYLSQKDVVKIGVCFQEQILDEVEIDELDIKMDFVVTDKSILRG